MLRGAVLAASPSVCCTGREGGGIQYAQRGAQLLTRHETVHMEQRHHEQGPVPVRQLIRDSDVVQAGRKIGMRQWNTLGLGGGSCVSSMLTTLPQCMRSARVYRSLPL